MPSNNHWSAANIRLRLLDLAVENDVYETVLDALSAGIRKAASKTKKAEKLGPPEYADFVTDAETEIIENLLGAAYVVCQAQITAVVQAALRAREQTVSDCLNFSAFSGNSRSVMALGAPFDSRFSKIEVMWALGNYFKHRDEWSPSTWENPSGPASRTVPVIQAAGLALGSTGNLRQGAEALGNVNYYDARVFKEIIREWSVAVRDLTRREFRG